jgi:putative colanic acid biosynthesis acetyltransferase WcaB
MKLSVFQDWPVNKNNVKGKILTFCFRLAQFSMRNRLLFYLSVPYLVFYKVIVEWVLGCELPRKTKVGKGLVIYHGQGLVVNNGTTIGENCVLRHNVTIGNKQTEFGLSECPTIGNNVDIGANAVLIGPINIGDSVIIGAGSVVVKSVPAGSIVAGNPARIIGVNQS